MHEWAVINSKHMSWISGCGEENERNMKIPKKKTNTLFLKLYFCWSTLMLL